MSQRDAEESVPDENPTPDAHPAAGEPPAEDRQADPAAGGEDSLLRGAQRSSDIVPAQVVAPHAEVEAEASTSVLPGEHRGGFARLPTAPIGIAQEVPPVLDEVGDWSTVEPPQLYRGIAGWALGFSIIALIASLFVGWGFPVGLVGLIAGIIALRRPIESRAVAVWAVVLGGVSVLYSAGWLAWAALQMQAG